MINGQFDATRLVNDFLPLLIIAATILSVVILLRSKRRRIITDSVESSFDAAKQFFDDLPEPIIAGIASGQISVTLEWSTVGITNDALVVKPRIEILATDGNSSRSVPSIIPSYQGTCDNPIESM